mgnify:CR=1 FL=1
MIPFTRIIQETLTEAQGVGVSDLCRLNQAMGYWAPEVKESWFWYGHGAILGYLDILNGFFRENKKVRDIYSKFLEEYYKDNNMQI